MARLALIQTARGYELATDDTLVVSPNGELGTGVTTGPVLPGGTVTALTNMDTLDVTGLDGQLDGDYWFQGEVTFPAPGGSVYDLVCEPNGITANQFSIRFFNSTGVLTGEANTSDLRIGSMTGGSPLTFTFEAYLSKSKTGGNRLWTYSAFRSDLLVHRGTGKWSDTTTPITSIRFNCRSGGTGQVAKFLTGSYVRWMALGRP